MKMLFATNKNEHEFIHIDPRTKMYILLIGNLSIFFVNSVNYELIIVSFILLFGILSGAYRFSFKMAIAYAVVFLTQTIGSLYLNGTFKIMIVSFCMFVRKIFPCGMFGGIIIITTRVNEFMAAMSRIHMPKSIIIPLTVMLRYFPVVKEDWGHIKDAMKMRGVSPFKTIECLYVPLMMSASKIADELSAAAVSRGIENPQERTCLQIIHFTILDIILSIIFTFLFIMAIVN